MKNLFLPSLLVLAACSSTSTTTTSTAATTSTANATAADASARPGFEVFAHDGRLTIFRTEDPELAAFRKSKDLGKSVTRIGAGPRGETIKAPDAETIAAYSLARPGFVTRVVDGRIWVFEAGSKAWDEYLSSGEPAKSVTQIGVGPGGETVKAPDAEVITRWLAAL